MAFLQELLWKIVFASEKEKHVVINKSIVWIIGLDWIYWIYFGIYLTDIYHLLLSP